MEGNEIRDYEDIICDPQLPQYYRAAVDGDRELLISCTLKDCNEPYRGYTALHLAVYTGKRETVQTLLESGVQVDVMDRGEQTPLHLASRTSNTDVVQLLLDNGADISARDEWQWTPLHWASETSNPDVVQLLLERGADISARDDRQQTPLHLASRTSNTDVVQLLLDNGANINSRDKTQQTPLHWASKTSNPAVVQLLLERGADINARDDWHQTPMQQALSANRIESASLMMRMKLTPQQTIFLDLVTSAEVIEDEQAKKFILNLQEHFEQKKDHTMKLWSEPEKLYFVETCFLHILMAGETFFGKTSIARSLLLMSPYTTTVHDRTRVLDYWSLKIDANTSVTLYDLGGHSSYRVLSHLFHNNSPQNLTMITHDMTSDKYSITCQWLTDIITRSPKMRIWLLLTKHDLLKTSDEIQQKKADFTAFVVNYLENETQSLVNNIRAFSDDSQKPHVRDVIKKYMSIREELNNGQIVHLVSCKHKDDIQNLHSSISELLKTPNFKVRVLPQVCELYTRLGKLGLERAAERKEALKQKATKKPQNLAPESNQSQKKNKELNQQEITGNDPNQLQSDQHKDEGQVDENIDLPQVEEDRDLSQVDEYMTQSQEMQFQDEHIHCLQYAEFEEVLKIYKEILPNSLSQTSLEKDLKETLHTLCSHGLILWFNGTENLQRFIFNDIGSFVNMLKSLFVPDIKELCYENLDEDQKTYILKNSDPANHNLSVNRLAEQGMMDVPLLKTLISKFDFEKHHDVVVDLLQHLSIAHTITPGNLLFFPWYLCDSESTDFKSLVAEMKMVTCETICWHICLEGHLPCPFYHAFCVQVYKGLLPDVDTQQRMVCKNHLSASIDDVNILIQHQKREDKEDEINIYIKSPLCISEFNKSWEFILECERAFKHLKETWWHGFGLYLYFKCQDCPLRGQTCGGSWPLNKITPEISKPTKKYCCPKKNNQKFPAALIYRLSEDEAVAEKCLEELRQHLEKHQRGHSMEWDPSTQREIHHVEHRQSTPMQVRPKEYKTSTQPPTNKVMLQGEEVTLKHFQILSDQIYIQGKVHEQHIEAVRQETHRVAAKVDQAEAKLASDIKLVPGRAATMTVTYRDPILKFCKNQLEEYLDVSDEMLDNLYSKGVMSEDDISVIQDDKEALGKRKRLLLFIDQNDRVCNFIEVLEECKSGTQNHVLGHDLRKKLDEGDTGN